MNRLALAALAFALAFTLSARAEARFGKSDSDDSPKDSKGSKHAPDTSGTHAATPVQPHPANVPSHHRESYEPERHPHFGYRPGHSTAVVDGPPVYLAYMPPPPLYGPGPIVVAPEPAQAARRVWADLRLDGNGFRDGGAAGLRVLVEGEHFGFDLGSTGILVRSDSSSGVDAIGLVDLDFSFAPVSGERGRIRLEGGLGLAFAPSMIAAGPQLGVSGEVRLIGPFGVEAAARVVPWPYTALDWHAALQLSLGALDLRMGVRQLYLDDNGHVDGVSHRDNFVGPYFGIGVRL